MRVGGSDGTFNHHGRLGRPCPKGGQPLEFDWERIEHREHGTHGALRLAYWKRQRPDGTRAVAHDRAEHEACEAGTPGCCIDHTHDKGDGCETW